MSAVNVVGGESDASPGDAVAVLALKRVRIDSARWHLERIIEIGDRLETLLGGFDAVARDSPSAVRDDARAAVDGPAAEARMTVARARASLAELDMWQEADRG